MANQLKMAQVQTILTLRTRGWSYRRISRELGVHRETVKRYVEQEAGVSPEGNTPAEADCQNRPNLPAGSGEQQADQNRPNPPAGSGPASKCEPFREIIEQKLEQRLSAQRIWQDLLEEHGFTGRYDSVKRFVRGLGGGARMPFRRMECDPGAEAQIDFGTGAPVVIPDDQPLPLGFKSRRRKTHVFRIVLSHSRKAYSEVVYRQTTENFIRCIENAFHYFGGVPETLVIDNLKAAVTKADWFDPELNPKIQSFCRHYGTAILPTKPRMPRHKGKTERGVDYVQENALKGRRFACLADQNQHLLEWEHQVADTRIHDTTRKQVKKAFEEVEKPALLALPRDRFPCFHEGKRKVNRDGHVEVDKAYYSVPPEYTTWAVWVRWDGRTVRVYNHRFEQIAYHVQKEPGRFSTNDDHIPKQKRSGVEKGTSYLLRKASMIGPHANHWATQLIECRGIEGVRPLMGLLNLTNKYASREIDQACEIALTHGAYRLRTVRELIKRQGDRQEQFAFIQEHPIIRPLGDYDELVHTAFTKEQAI